MKRQLITFTIASILTATTAFAQDYTPPKDPKLKKADDYAKYEEDVLKCIAFLEETPINEKVQQQKEADAFFFQWLSGAPNVSITLYEYVTKFADVYPQYMFTFFGGATKMILENKETKFTEEEIQMGGLKAVIAKYQKDKESKRDKLLDKLSKMDDDKLLTWLQGQMKKK